MGKGGDRTMEPEYHLLCGRTTQPVRFGAVRKRDILRGEAALFGERWISYIEVRE